MVRIKDISKGVAEREIQKYAKDDVEFIVDKIIRESPLQIVIAHGNASNRVKEVLSVSMRTQGDDFNLVTGFLFCEGIIQKASDIISIKYIGNPDDEELQENTVLVELAFSILFKAEEHKRNFLSSSACGFCGKTIDDITSQKDIFLPLNQQLKINPSVLYSLPSLLRLSQGLFSETGGAHAVALISGNAELRYITEDVGRHNAMDKLVGAMLKEQALPLYNNLLLFSGRLSYELVQKSLMAGVSIVCAIGAPTSLAVNLAEDYGMTVIGFLKNNSFNIYCGAEKIIPS